MKNIDEICKKGKDYIDKHYTFEKEEQKCDVKKRRYIIGRNYAREHGGEYTIDDFPGEMCFKTNM